jgi:hypothetical protein
MIWVRMNVVPFLQNVKSSPQNICYANEKNLKRYLGWWHHLTDMNVHLKICITYLKNFHRLTSRASWKALTVIFQEMLNSENVSTNVLIEHLRKKRGRHDRRRRRHISTRILLERIWWTAWRFEVRIDESDNMSKSNRKMATNVSAAMPPNTSKIIMAWVIHKLLVLLWHSD